MRNDYFWVIGGGILQLPLIEELRKMNIKTIVSDLNPNCICATEADFFLEIDIFDVESHLQQAKKLKNIKIRGVLAAGIDAPITMARLSEKLGLPSVSSDIAKIVYNKDLFREKMKELSYPTPRYEVIETERKDDWKKIIDKFGYPLIIKNTSSSGSRGTRIFYKKNDLGVFEVIKKARKVSLSSRALVEEVWEGEEFTVEGIIDVNSNFHRCSITDRLFDKSSGYPIETGLRHPTYLSKEVQDELFQLAEIFARDLQVKIGVVKYDIILTSAGPRIIEMTVRLSGGFDSQYLVPLTTGKNLLKAAIFTAMGKEIPNDILKPKKNLVGVTGSIWPLPGKIKEIKGVDEAKKINGIAQIFLRYKIGDVLLPYEDCTKRVIFIISLGFDEKTARNTLLKAMNKIEFKVDNSSDGSANIIQLNNKTKIDEEYLLKNKVKTSKFDNSVLNFKDKVVNKPWGYEYLLYENKDVAIWILYIKHKHGTSMHCHPRKRTSLIVLSGKVICTTSTSNFERKPGNGLVLGRGLYHQTKTLNENGSFVMEIESPIDKTDLVRYLDNYGRENLEYENDTYYSTNFENYKHYYDINSNKIMDFIDTTVNYNLYKTYSDFLIDNNLAGDDSFVILNRGLWDDRGNMLFEVGEVINWNSVKGNPSIKVKENLEIITISKRGNHA